MDKLLISFSGGRTSAFMAKMDFEPALDESKYKPEYKQMDLFDIDISNGCIESCEVF